MTRMLIAVIALAVRLANAQALPWLTPTREVVVNGSAMHVVRTSVGAVSPAGRIYVVGYLGRELLVFGPDGKALPTIGRYGEGPGDFHGMHSIGFIGDSIWISDANLQRATLYTPEAKLIGTAKIDRLKFPKDFPFTLPKFSAHFPVAVYGDGSMLVRGEVYGTYVTASDSTSAGLPLLRVAKDGTVQRLIGWIPVPHDIYGPASNPSKWLIPRFQNKPVFAFSPDAGLFVTVVASVTGTAPSARVTVVRTTGDTVYSRPIAVSAPPIPAELATRLSSSGTLNPTEKAAAIAAATRLGIFPRFYPPLKSVFVSRSGRLLIGFVSESEQGADPTSGREAAARADSGRRDYLILDATGKPVAGLNLPVQTTVLQFDDDVIWASDLDSDRVPSIARYRLGPPKT
jgi:hypothetical protein